MSLGADKIKLDIELSTFENIYFIGIGGIGMSALARYFLSIGKKIAGYDRVRTPLTKELEHEGMQIHYQDDLSLIPNDFKDNKTTFVIYTPAIKELGELAFFEENKFKLFKRAEVLGMITRQTKCLAVAGTHGKTTTSSILAHMLVEGGTPVSVFLGGIYEGFKSNFISNGNEYSVVEADEFDRSFLKISPYIACINAVEADHLDIYGTYEEFEQAFSEFTEKIVDGGTLVLNNKVKGITINDKIKVRTFGLEGEAYYSFADIKTIDNYYYFTFLVNKEEKGRFCFPFIGRHNLSNALAALSVVAEAGFDVCKFADYLKTFAGVERRFVYVLNTKKHILIDDYAHHPSEIEALHAAVRERHPGAEVSIVFQPHLFTRTRDFMSGFASALSSFDRVVLLDIYPAREKPIPGITSSALADLITAKEKIVLSKEELPNWVDKVKPHILLMVGAGDISFEVEKVKKMLENEE